MLCRLLATFVLLFTISGLLRADDAPAADESAPAPAAEQAAEAQPEPAETEAQPGDADPAAEDGDAQAQFDAVFTEWKEALKAIRTVQIEYRAAADDEKPALRTEFDERLAAARQVLPRLKVAAERAYVADPKKNAEVAKFLWSMVAEEVGVDSYEEAYRLSKLLIDRGDSEAQISLLGGFSAFNVGDYGFARKHLAIAEKAGLLRDPPERASEIQKQVVTRAQMASAVIDQHEKLWQAEQKIRAAEAEADDLPRVKLETSEGDLLIELYENEAPNTVANFISLVEQGFYDGLIFHRVIPIFMAQGGCPRGTGNGGPGYHIACEVVQPNHRKHFRGTLSMAHAGRDTGGSQFFLTFLPTPHLDGQHTAFGRVIDGLDVLAKLQRVEADMRGQLPSGAEPDRIVKATVVRKRDHEYKPETLPERR